MNRDEFGNLFNRIMEDIDRLANSMPEVSKERRHMNAAQREILDAIKWLGLPTITVAEYEALRKKNPPQLHSVKNSGK